MHGPRHGGCGTCAHRASIRARNEIARSRRRKTSKRRPRSRPNAGSACAIFSIAGWPPTFNRAFARMASAPGARTGGSSPATNSPVASFQRSAASPSKTSNARTCWRSSTAPKERASCARPMSCWPTSSRCSGSRSPAMWSCATRWRRCSSATSVALRWSVIGFCRPPSSPASLTRCQLPA